MAWNTVVDTDNYKKFTWDASFAMTANVTFDTIALPAGPWDIWIKRTVDGGTATIGNAATVVTCKFGEDVGTMLTPSLAMHNWIGGVVSTAALNSTNIGATDALVRMLINDGSTFTGANDKLSTVPFPMELDMAYTAGTFAGTRIVTEWSVIARRLV